MPISLEDIKEKTYQLVSRDEALLKKSSRGYDVRIFVHEEKITFGNFVIPPNGGRLGRISAHGCDEIYYVLRGTLKVELPRVGETVEVKAGSILYMPAGMIHAPYNDREEETEVLWVCAPEWP